MDIELFHNIFYFFLFRNVGKKRKLKNNMDELYLTKVINHQFNDVTMVTKNCFQSINAYFFSN